MRSVGVISVRQRTGEPALLSEGLSSNVIAIRTGIRFGQRAGSSIENIERKD